MDHGHTIAAIATPPGQGAIAVIRLSGEKSFEICEKVFHPADSGPPLTERGANTIHYGRIHDNGEIVDEVLLALFHSPRSYTGEDVAEISCHGSVYLQQKILKLLLDNGAVLAKPGEFTKRAFLNGKMDLSQAEAVADLIASESAAFHKVALKQMRGGFSEEISALRQRLLDFISLVELELDFSEEDVEFADRNELQSLLASISGVLESLTGSFAFGNVLKNGIPVVIAGKPNVGKSTLLNALLREEKALVSEIPGTTRDSIEDVIHLEGVSFRFIDTAGLRETTDTVEVMGIRRTMEKVKQASIILLMVEAADTRKHINHLIDGLLSKSGFADKKMVLLLNKADLLPDNGQRIPYQKSDFPPLREQDHIIEISAKTNSGLDRLRSLLVSIIQQEKPGENEIIVTSMRHYHALKNAHEAVLRASEGLKYQLPGDLLAMDIREVLHYLGEITGEITTDEILGNIFKNFCIGK
ncbi:MAG: tRNA uridine-5-carboxymethylaminomethyl(34) synthesis GTPase MnmE [Bacteroidales bacterium]